MKDKDRIKKFIELQDKDMNFEDIALELGIVKSTLRRFLNKNGYKLDNGKYKLKNDVNEDIQIEFEQNIKQKKNKSSKVKDNKNKEVNTNKEKEVKKINNKNKEENLIKEVKIKENNQKTKISKKSNPKKDRKINITQEDLDKLCEVYDWYMEVKDLKVMKSKNKINKKDIKVEDTNLTSLKTTSIRVDKKTWEDFERLCSNSEFSKQEIITQALKDFMKEYKNLL